MGKISDLKAKLKEGQKHDQDKLRWDLLPVEEIEEIVKVLTYGVKKYEANSWQLVPNAIERYYAALLRHIVDWRKGEDLDEESKLKHLSHAATNIIFLLYLTKGKDGK